MKRIRSFLIVFAMTLTGATPVFAAYGFGQGDGRTDVININDYNDSYWDRFTFNYEFETGETYRDIFGEPTYVDTIPYNPELLNVRRNKDSAKLPPSYGIFSGEIPTDFSSPYHNNATQVFAVNGTYPDTTNNYYALPETSVNAYSETGVLQSTSTLETASSSTGSNIQISYSNTNTNTGSKTTLTEVSYYDGSIGTLKIPVLGTTVKVYEGETLDSMKKGAGHFEFTSARDGNIGIAAHNRGSSGYFEGVKNLDYGDEIIYTTPYGTRRYEVTNKGKISDTDYSYLGWSGENMITLITCVEGVSTQRWCIQAKQV